ncbi:hypothetical protein Tco_0022621, partial [Tanacetum coccineum]
SKPKSTLDDSTIFDDQDADHGVEPMPTIEAKDKGKGVLKESPINKVKRSNLDVAQIAKDAEIARLIHEKELAEMEREREERQRQDQASVDYIASLYDEGKYRRNQLNKKTFEEIQALYNKEQERDTDFVPIRSEKDEKMIDKINKKASGMDKEEVPKEPESTKVEVKQEGREKNNWKRSDFIELHSLVMQRFSITTPEGIDLVLWGDLRIMFEETTNDDIWKNQEKWIIKSWTFYEKCGVHILALEDGTEIHMLAERRYPLIRETLERMMELRLTDESEGEAVFYFVTPPNGAWTEYVSEGVTSS